MSATAIGAEDAMPRRVRVVRPTPVSAPVADTRARTRASTRAPYLRPVPDAGPVAEPAPRPTRGGTAGRVDLGATTAPARGRTAAAKAAAKARAASMPKLQVGHRLRLFGRVFYRDAADGWLMQGRTLSVAEVAQLRYAVPGDWGPFRIWCTVYTRSVGPVVAAILDGAKWVLIHPVRGPLAGAGTAAALIAPHVIH